MKNQYQFIERRAIFHSKDHPSINFGETGNVYKHPIKGRWFFIPHGGAGLFDVHVTELYAIYTIDEFGESIRMHPHK
jgi:hypothetical protein